MLGFAANVVDRKRRKQTTMDSEKLHIEQVAGALRGLRSPTGAES
jgi:hypothetical protein